MIVQGLNNIASAYGASYKSAIGRQTSLAPTANFADKVTLSAESKTLAAGEATGTREGVSLSWQTAVIKNTKEFPSWGEKFTHDFAYDDSYQTTGPLVDISNRPTLRYTYTGEVVTDQNLSEFKAEAATARIERIALYEAEKAKGTPNAEILEKLFRYTDSRSDSYLNIVGWERAAESVG